LQAIKPFYRRPIVEAIDAQLAHQPTVETKNRKLLPVYKRTFNMTNPSGSFVLGSIAYIMM
jgi:hypothetical protein